MRRGKRWAVGICALLGMLAVAAPAGAKERLNILVAGPATNGYEYTLQASKSSGGEKFVSLELTRGDAGAFYSVKRPQRFDRHRLVADFGDMGRVSLRPHPRQASTCDPFDFGFFGRFRGAIRFKGESVYTRVRDERPRGFFFNWGCRKDKGLATRAAAPREDEDPILVSCSDDGRTGFFGATDGRGGPAAFLAARFERTPDLLIGRTVFIDGATRNLRFLSGRRAKVRPPEPFYGRAEVANGRIEGRLRVGLPGAGLVRLTPGDADLVPPGEFDPACFPFALAEETGSANVARFARAIAR